MGRIWTRLEKGEIQSIGVWGMRGVGKTIVVTRIHNRLLENKDTFGHVYCYQKNQAFVGWKMILLKR